MFDWAGNILSLLWLYSLFNHTAFARRYRRLLAVYICAAKTLIIYTVLDMQIGSFCVTLW